MSKYKYTPNRYQLMLLNNRRLMRLMTAAVRRYVNVNKDAICDSALDMTLNEVKIYADNNDDVWSINDVWANITHYTCPAIGVSHSCNKEFFYEDYGTARSYVVDFYIKHVYG